MGGALDIFLYIQIRKWYNFLLYKKGASSMASAKELRFRKGDLIAIALVLLLAISVFLCFLPRRGEEAAYAQIYLNGQLVKTVALDQDQTFQIQDRYCNQITVSDGKIAITDADCPGQDCVHSGSIHQSGRILVCLPNGLEIRIVSSDADVDFVVG